MSCEIFISGPPTQYTCEPHGITFEPQDEGYPETCPSCPECGGKLPAKPLDPGCSRSCFRKPYGECHSDVCSLLCGEAMERRWTAVALLSLRAIAI